MTYTVIPDVTHGDYLVGTTDLRLLWNNLIALAGDDGTGYAENGHDTASGYPLGYAMCAYRNQAVAAGVQGDTVRTRFYLRRTRDYLRYRAWGKCEMVYIDANGEEVRKTLGECDTTLGDPYDYRILDLGEVDGLAYGMEYYLEVLDPGNSLYDPDHPTQLDFAEECF